MVNSDIYKNKKIVILFDEIFTAVEKTGGLRKNVLEFLAQCRKRGIVLITTVQEWAELNITLRRFVRYQVTCSMFSPFFLPFAIVRNNINDGDTLHWDTLSNDWVADRIQTNFRKGLKDIIMKYDTFETISNNTLLNK